MKTTSNLNKRTRGEQQHAATEEEVLLEHQVATPTAAAESLGNLPTTCSGGLVKKTAFQGEQKDQDFEQPPTKKTLELIPRMPTSILLRDPSDAPHGEVLERFYCLRIDAKSFTLQDITGKNLQEKKLLKTSAYAPIAVGERPIEVIITLWDDIAKELYATVQNDFACAEGKPDYLLYLFNGSQRWILSRPNNYDMSRNPVPYASLAYKGGYRNYSTAKPTLFRWERDIVRKFAEDHLDIAHPSLWKSVEELDEPKILYSPTKPSPFTRMDIGGV
jgi:hypothetical protein